MRKYLIPVLLLVLLNACGGGGEKTLRELKAEHLPFFEKIETNLKAISSEIVAKPVESNTPCKLSSPLIFDRKDEGRNADFIFEESINDWSKSTGEGLSTTGSTFEVSEKFTRVMFKLKLHELFLDSPDETLEKDVDVSKKLKYLVILNSPNQMGLEKDQYKMDFYIYNIETNKIECSFFTLTTYSRDSQTLESNIYEDGKKVRSEGVVENWQTHQKELILEEMKRILTADFGAKFSPKSK